MKSSFKDLFDTMFSKQGLDYAADAVGKAAKSYSDYSHAAVKKAGFKPDTTEPLSKPAPTNKTAPTTKSSYTSKPGVVSKAELDDFRKFNPGATLGQYMNAIKGKTAVKGGANDPTSANFKADKSQGDTKWNPDDIKVSSSGTSVPEPAQSPKPEPAQTPTPPSRPADLDVKASVKTEPDQNKSTAPGVPSVPAPKPTTPAPAAPTPAPIPPKRPSGLSEGINKVPSQKGSNNQGSGTLGALEHRYGSSKKLAQEATKVALQKSTDQKMLNPGKTATGQPADPIEVNPVKAGMQQQSVN